MTATRKAEPVQDTAPVIRGVQTCGAYHPDRDDLRCEMAEGHTYHLHMVARFEEPTAPMFSWRR